MIIHGRPPEEATAGGDRSYIHHQNNPASTWVINHNLGKFPTVDIQDSAGNWWLVNPVHVSPNQLTLTFTTGAGLAAFSGTAYLN